MLYNAERSTSSDGNFIPEEIMETIVRTFSCVFMTFLILNTICGLVFIFPLLLFWDGILLLLICWLGFYAWKLNFNLSWIGIYGVLSAMYGLVDSIELFERIKISICA